MRDGYAGTTQERRDAVSHFYLHAALNLGNRIAMREGSKRRRHSRKLLDEAFRAEHRLCIHVSDLGQTDESGERRRLDELLSILDTFGISFASELPRRAGRARRRKDAKTA